MVMLSELALGRWWGRGWYLTFNPCPIHNIPCLFLRVGGRRSRQEEGEGWRRNRRRQEEEEGWSRRRRNKEEDGGGGEAGNRSRQQEQQHVLGS